MSKEKKEIRIPRLWVYVCAFLSGLFVTTAFGISQGVGYAADFITNSAIYGCIFVLTANVFDRVERQPYRLTVKYWVLVAFILVTDFLFMFAARAVTKDDCIVRLCIFAVGLILTSFYAYFIYAPSQKEIFEEVKANAVEGIASYLDENGGQPTKTLAEGIVEMLFAPKKKEEEEATEGEEANA